MYTKNISVLRSDKLTVSQIRWGDLARLTKLCIVCREGIWEQRIGSRHL